MEGYENLDPEQFNLMQRLAAILDRLTAAKKTIYGGSLYETETAEDQQSQSSPSDPSRYMEQQPTGQTAPAGETAPAGTAPAAAPAATTSAPAATASMEPLTSGGLEAVGTTTGEGAGYTGLGPAAYVAAAILGQHLMSGETDRQFSPKGAEESSHRTGDVFSLDFFTEPWQPFLYEKLGVNRPTPGEKTDASINAIRDKESAWDNLAKSTPGTAAQWFDPVGSSLYDILSAKGGQGGEFLANFLQTASMGAPIHGIARLFD